MKRDNFTYNSSGEEISHSRVILLPTSSTMSTSSTVTLTSVFLYGVTLSCLTTHCSLILDSTLLRLSRTDSVHFCLKSEVSLNNLLVSNLHSISTITFNIFKG